MIIYNTLVGVCAGVALILVPALMRRLAALPVTEPVDPASATVDKRLWAGAFAVLGTALAVLGGLIATTWPLFVNKPINIVFGEPTLLLGLLLLAASAYLWRTADSMTRPVDVAAVGWIVFALGLVLASCAIGIARFQLVGAAPAEEPITGLLHDWPWIENSFFAGLYGLAAIGALLAPAAGLSGNLAGRIVRTVWTLAGVLFLAFSALNYYTHIGLLINQETGTHYRF